jgi:hypothetical protein
MVTRRDETKPASTVQTWQEKRIFLHRLANNLTGNDGEWAIETADRGGYISLMQMELLAVEKLILAARADGFLPNG